MDAIVTAVVCDWCGGRRYVDGVLCEKCLATGRIPIGTAKPKGSIRKYFGPGPVLRWLRDRWLWLKWFSWQ